MENEIAHLQRTISLRGWPTITPTNCVRLPLVRRGDLLSVSLYSPCTPPIPRFCSFLPLLPFAPFSFAISDRRRGFFLSSVRASSSLERSTRGYLSFDLFVNAKFHAGSSAWKVGHLIKMANPFEVSVWRSKKIEDLPFFVRVRVFDYLIRNYRFLCSGKYKNALKYTNLLMFLTPQIFILSFFCILCIFVYFLLFLSVQLRHCKQKFWFS